MPNIKKKPTKPASKVKTLAKNTPKKKVASKATKTVAKKSSRSKSSPTAKLPTKSRAKQVAKKSVASKVNAKLQSATKKKSSAKSPAKSAESAKKSTSPSKVVHKSSSKSLSASNESKSITPNHLANEPSNIVSSPASVSVYFGLEGYPLVEVTDRVIDKCSNGGGVWAMPMEDSFRARIFGDPAPNKVKKVFVRPDLYDARDNLEQIVLVGEKASFTYVGGTLSFNLVSPEINPAPTSATVYYGLGEYELVDITAKVIDRCIYDKADSGLWSPPLDDAARARLFGDPVPNRAKEILVKSHTEDGHIIEKIVSAGELCSFSFNENILSVY